MKATIAPSLLSGDFLNLLADIRLMEKSGAKVLHLDVMDGHFVPNLTFGPPTVRAIREVTDLTLDVHLMIANAEQTFKDYISAGADFVSVHVEAVANLEKLLCEITKAGAKAGVALNPDTPLEAAENVLDKCHHALLMSVNPGFGGQEFIPATLNKARQLQSAIRRKGQSVLIEVDGGIGKDNVRDVVKAGGDLLVSGSSIFGFSNPEKEFRRLQEIALEARVDSRTV
jgi:ribulose-phosphate 3-epimerase